VSRNPPFVNNPTGRSPFTPVHKVQFYEKDDDLTIGLGSTLGSVLGAGGSAIVIATKPHREAIWTILEARGLDVSYVMQEGRYTALDARETLSKILVNGWPDPERFQSTVGTLIDEASAAASVAQGYVAAFGEMVALLWKAGSIEQAIRLEQMWNELAQTRTFCLHCAYPMGDFNHTSHEEPFSRICSEHTQVIPGESYSLVRTESERSRVVSLLQQKVQAYQKMSQEKAHQQREVISELSRCLRKFGAGPELLAAVTSWMETMDEDRALSELKALNSPHTIESIQ
jgi:hypothetical protein